MRERQQGRWERRREEREERKLMVRERDCGRNGRERVRVQRLQKSGIVKLGREGEGLSVRRRKEKIRERESRRNGVKHARRIRANSRKDRTEERRINRNRGKERT